MRTTAEICRDAIHRAVHETGSAGDVCFNPWVQRLMLLAATYACELAQADAAALLKPVTMRKEEGGTRR